MNFVPNQLTSAPLSSKFKTSAWLTLLSLGIATIGWGIYRTASPDVPVPPTLKALPYLKIAIQATQLPQITAQALKEKIDRQDTDYVLVDVRSPRAFQASRIPSAISIPLFVFQEDDSVEHIKALLNGRKLIVYGTSGYRSAQALLKLNQQGLSGIHVVGGMAGWETAIESQ
jgi:rhodanese-related sulfurtransferase